MRKRRFVWPLAMASQGSSEGEHPSGADPYRTRFGKTNSDLHVSRGDANYEHDKTLVGETAGARSMEEK